uniref:Uncharacterized protein n=1 Tax=Meloidogyne enterolobii TaxID=390850 RepID=A0A6V7XWF8_MELEN|nr:unnamed protein product [Meloidogyne enterolobii]
MEKCISVLLFFKKSSSTVLCLREMEEQLVINLCLLLENRHYNYIGRPEQLLGVKRYCIDCERSVTRWSHWAGGSVVCRFCMRTGPDFPCQREEFHVKNCGFVFPRRSCYDYHLINSAPNEMIRRDARTFASICQMRRICNNCHHNILAQQHHDCQQQTGPPQIICKIVMVLTQRNNHVLFSH